MVIETTRYQFSLRGLLALITACAVFWALLQVIDSPARTASICLSIPGFLSLGFCLMSLKLGHRGFRSKLGIAVASTLLSLALFLSLFIRP